MISASVVLFHTSIEQLLKVIRSYAPSSERLLFLIDNSPCEMSRKDKNRIGINGVTIFYKFTGWNMGYGSAHNIGIQRAEETGSTYHIVLNPDLYFDPDSIDRLREYADRHKDVVYMLPKVLYPDGSLQYLCKLLPDPMDLIFRRFLPKTKRLVKRNNIYELRMSGYDKIFNPPCLSGCFMFLRVEALKKYHLRFDERYFMYCEDFDFIRRLHRRGKTIFYPYVTIIHNHAHESYKNKKMLMIHIRSAILYFNKFGWIRDEERDRENKKVLNEIKILNRLQHQKTEYTENANGEQ